MVLYMIKNQNQNNNKKYSYSETTAGFSMIILVIVLSGCSIGTLLEVKILFSKRDLQIL